MVSKFMLVILIATNASTAAIAETDWSRDAPRDAAAINKLVAEIGNVLPAGWVVDFKVHQHRVVGGAPIVVISSVNELPVVLLGPGMPPPPWEPKPMKVTLELECMKRVSPERHRTLREENAKFEAARRAFIHERLAGIQIEGKDSEPQRPFCFMPRTAEEAQRVQEYALLCLETEPTRLPTHHYEGLSLEFSRWMLEIRDRGRDAEYRQIVKRLEKMLTAYEPERAE